MKKFFGKFKSFWRKYIAELSVINWEDVAVRAVKTFFQIAITYAATALAGVDFSKQLGGTFWLGFILSAGSAGVSAVWNSVLMPVLNPGKTKSTMDDYLAKLAIEKAKKSSNTQPTLDDTNG